MAYQTAVAVPRSGNVWIDGLTDGYRWGTSSENPAIGYTFIGQTRDLPGGEFGGYPSQGWSEQERQLMLDAMQGIADVSGLRFIDRGDNNDDNVELWFYTLDRRDADGSYGFAYTPGSDSDEGLVAINRSMYQTSDFKPKHSIAPGSFYGITFLHELCHAVGLKHPHDSGLKQQPRFPGLTRRSNQYRDSGMFNQNAHPFTQLTYVDKGARNGYVPTFAADHGFLQTLGALDIAALQWLYGINPNASSGRDVYRLPLSNTEGTGWRAIWDTGGIDRIDGSLAEMPVTIDLRNATLGQDDAAGGYPSSAEGVFGGFTIAHDWNGVDLTESAGLCIIEHATGGRAGDRLIGNQASNRLRGRRGDDVLYGGLGGKDRLIGGPGRDQFWIEAESGSFAKVRDFQPELDQLVFDVPRESLSLSSQADDLLIQWRDVPIARLKGVDSLDWSSQVLFSGFEGL